MMFGKVMFAFPKTLPVLYYNDVQPDLTIFAHLDADA